MLLGAPALEVLSVTGEGVLRCEASEAWSWWLQGLGQLRSLQVGGGFMTACVLLCLTRRCDLPLDGCSTSLLLCQLSRSPSVS